MKNAETMAWNLRIKYIKFRKMFYVKVQREEHKLVRSIQLDKDYIQREKNYWRIPGLAVVLIQPGQEDQILCLGYRDVENKLPVDEDTQFCIASCSKSMTAALVAKLVDLDQLSFDKPIKDMVPDLMMKDKTANDEMTIRDMLCHRTGLGGHDALWPGSITRKELAQRLRYLEPNLPFRQKAQYSNLIYALAGYVTEAVSGESWDVLLRNYLLAPLKMERTTCTAQEILSDDNHAVPYKFVGSTLTRLPFWNVDLAGPAASVNSTPKDMAKWLHFHIDGGKGPSGEVLISEKNFRQMHEKQMDYVDSAGLAEDCYPGKGYCMGWQCGDYRGHRFQKHSGKIEGYSTLQVYLPEDQIGVAILMNLHSPSTPVFYTMLYRILDRALGYPDAHWEKRFRDQQEEAPIERYDDCEEDLTTGYLSNDAKGELSEHPFGDYVGEYFEPGYGTVTIEMRNGQLYLQYRDQTLPLHHWGRSSFWLDGVKEDDFNHEGSRKWAG